MLTAPEFAVLISSYASLEPRWMVKFADHTAGVFPLADEDAEELRLYPGVECMLKLKPGTNIDIDPRSLAFNVH